MPSTYGQHFLRYTSAYEVPWNERNACEWHLFTRMLSALYLVYLMQELAPKMDIFDMSTVQSELREILGQEQQLLLADIDQLQALLVYETTMQVRTQRNFLDYETTMHMTTSAKE
jgi:hypothetical protein